MSTLHPESEYYLHTNGTVHFKPHGDVEPDSPMVVRVWNANHIGTTPQVYLDWLRELRELGASESELHRLVDTQKLTEFIPDAKKQLHIAAAPQPEQPDSGESSDG